MTIEDFIKLPAHEAAAIYGQHRDAGEAGEASRLHQAYYEVHRVRLSDDRQIAEAQSIYMAADAALARPAKAAKNGARSKVRRMGIFLSCLGLLTAACDAAAGLDVVGVIFAGCLASSGFAMWLVGIIEDRLLEVRHALATYRG